MRPAEQRHITVVLIDAYPLVRHGLRALLDPLDDVVLAGDASDLESLGHLDVEPDVAVTDLMVPDGPDVSAVAAIGRRFPGTAILVLSTIDDLGVVEEALRAGANGYVAKDAVATELIDAIRVVAGGGAYLQPALGMALARRQQSEDAGMSERERAVLRLIALGHTNAEIGDVLDVSLRTVETTRARVSQKVGASSRADLVRYAYEHGLGADTRGP